MSADDRLSEMPFSYRYTADDRLFIDYEHQCVTILNGRQANKLNLKLQAADARGQQLLLAKATGNFKRGNEKAGRD